MHSESFLILPIHIDGTKKTKLEVLGNMQNNLCKWIQVKEHTPTKLQKAVTSDPPNTIKTLGVWEKIYPTPKASNLINKEKAHDNESWW